MNKKSPAEIDFYALEETWTKELKSYPDTSQKEVIPTAKRVFKEAIL